MLFSSIKMNYIKIKIDLYFVQKLFDKNIMFKNKNIMLLVMILIKYK